MNVDLNSHEKTLPINEKRIYKFASICWIHCRLLALKPANLKRRLAVSSISRTFLLLLVMAFSVVVVFAVRLSYVYADFSNQGMRLVQNLQTTSLLSQE